MFGIAVLGLIGIIILAHILERLEHPDVCPLVMQLNLFQTKKGALLISNSFQS